MSSHTDAELQPKQLHFRSRLQGSGPAAPLFVTAATLPASPHPLHSPKERLECLGVPRLSPTWFVVIFLSAEQAPVIHTACGWRIGFRVTDGCRKILCGVRQKINRVL